MQPERPTNIDSPTTNDRLGFKAYANGISAAIVDATVRNQLPMTVGIYGRWGSGKTSLMKMVEAALVPNGAERPKTEGDREAVHKRERGLKWWLGIVGVMVVVGFLATPFAAHKIAGIYPKFAPTAQFAAFFCVFAGFGACARAGFETWWRGSVLETLDDG
ncbi:MAG TPA: P-loop NTPase fold protein, partial [Candidatus Acidoferrum sp.]|nr:P-loop NTPase fold protein [Candidatus Acidoferrum sp.]